MQLTCRSHSIEHLFIIFLATVSNFDYSHDAIAAVKPALKF